MQKEIEEAREPLVERLLDEGTTSTGFYAATKTLATASPVAQWSFEDLFVGQSPEVICRKVLEFFGGIAGMAPENEQFLETTRINGGLDKFDEEAVTNSLKRPSRQTPQSTGTPWHICSRGTPRCSRNQ